MKVIRCSESSIVASREKILLSAYAARKNLEDEETAYRIVLTNDTDWLKESLAAAPDARQKLLLLVSAFPQINRARQTFEKIGTAAGDLNMIENRLVPFFDTYPVQN